MKIRAIFPLSVQVKLFPLCFHLSWSGGGRALFHVLPTFNAERSQFDTPLPSERGASSYNGEKEIKLNTKKKKKKTSAAFEIHHHGYNEANSLTIMTTRPTNGWPSHLLQKYCFHASLDKRGTNTPCTSVYKCKNSFKNLHVFVLSHASHTHSFEWNNTD